MMFHLSLKAAIAVITLVAVQPATFGDELCPLVLGCCEEDCCGEGTSWDANIAYCIINPNSSGFDGTHSSAWIEGCIERVCCEGACCSPAETEYDDINAACVPTGKPIIECSSSEDCESGYCYLGLGSPGTCSCNPDKNMGCTKEYVCAGEGQLAEAQGMVFIVEPKPECLLPFGAACSPNDPGMCLTGVCDFQTKTCGCNYRTSYPCETKNGETCLFLDGAYVCANNPPGGEGPFEIGEPCIVNKDCVSGSCYYGLRIPGSPGTCSCNPETNAGCSGEEECASSEEVSAAQSVTEVPPGCYLPDGATCDPSESKCLSGACDKMTLQCTCNTFSNYPCADRGEVCVLDENNIHVCQLGKPPILECPKPSGVCTADYAPVVCDGCEYSNQCLATAAGFTFDACKLVPLDPDPTGTPGEEAMYYSSTSGLFKVKLPLFSSAAARGYTNQNQFAQDLMEACKFKVNRAVEQNEYYYYLPMLSPDDSDSPTTVGVDSPTTEGVDDYDTNVQEEGVDEGDLLKTNGEYAFVGYGDYVVVWEVATGRYITNMTLPPIKDAYVQPSPKPPQSGGLDGHRKALAPPLFGPVRPTIQSLLLHDNKLVVIANGYGQSVRSKLKYAPTLYDAFSTNIRIYDISTLSTTEEVIFVKETHVHGYFDSARAIDNRVHLVSFSGLDTYTFLDDPLARWQPNFQNLSEEDYLKAARKLAEEKLCPKFVDGVIRDLSSHGELANVAQVALWQSQLSTDRTLEDAVFGQGVINSYGQVTTFDISDSSEELGVTVSGVLMPTGWGYTYATEEMLVIAGQGWNWVEDTGGSVETTYLHGFALLDDGRTAPAAVGSLKGRLINNYAVDIVDGYMRVATTIRNEMWIFTPVDAAILDGAVAPLQPERSTENYIIVLKIPELDGTDPGILEEVGRTKSLGKDGEVFTGVRFSDDVAYVVTFERKDPFYVISFENPEKPVVLGELNITGFSSYLHFVNDAHTLLLGVGQEADEGGTVLGLQVTLYDSTDPANPSVIDRYAVEVKDDVYSSSAVEWDFKALRYVALGDDFGILIIPVRVDSYTSTEGNFDGFILLDISVTSIAERFRISHVDSEGFRLGCFYWAQLPERSFVVNGNVTTLKGHSIRIHDLDSGSSTGGIDLDTDVDQDRDICIYW